MAGVIAPGRAPAATPLDPLVLVVALPTLQARLARLRGARRATRRDRPPSPRARAPPPPAARPAAPAAPRSACAPPSSAAPGPGPRPLRLVKPPRPWLLHAQRHPSQHLHRPSMGRQRCPSEPWGGGSPQPRSEGGKRGPASRQALRAGDPATLERAPPTQPHRGQDELRRAARARGSPPGTLTARSPNSKSASPSSIATPRSASLSRNPPAEPCRGKRPLGRRPICATRSLLSPFILQNGVSEQL